MTMWTLVIANLWRHPMRSALATVSLIVAFVLLMLLQSISARFAADAESTDTALTVRPKHLSGYLLPNTHGDTIRSIEGVVGATPMLGFTGYYQDPKQGFGSWVVDPDEWLKTLTRTSLDAAAAERFRKTRTGAVISTTLAERWGWAVGDNVNILSRSYPQENSSHTWSFDIVGVARSTDETPIGEVFFFGYDYFNEASRFNKHRGNYFRIRVDRPENADRVSREVDAALSITPQPTQTFTTDYLSRSAGRQLGDIGRIVTLIIAAVFFSVVLVAGHAAMQGVRERLPEFAAMRTLGFSRPFIVCNIFLEQAILCSLSAAIGIVIAAWIHPIFNANLVAYVGNFEIAIDSVWITLATAGACALIVSFAPAIESWRMNLVDKLVRD